MALSEEAKKIWEKLMEVVTDATAIFTELKNSNLLSSDEIKKTEEYVNIINTVASKKHTTDKQVKEIEIEVQTAYTALLRMKERVTTFNDSSNSEEQETEDNLANEEVETIIYIGPTLRKYGITSNTSFVGTKKDTNNFFAQAIKDIPEIEKMLVLTYELAGKKKLLNDKNNAFYNIYKTVERKSKEV
ncbi:MAG: hypothetical protein Q4D26_10370 [Clostridia bacterium]|nr:hypothetical protein [Clostridia bacterium]